MSPSAAEYHAYLLEVAMTKASRGVPLSKLDSALIRSATWREQIKAGRRCHELIVLPGVKK